MSEGLTSTGAARHCSWCTAARLLEVRGGSYADCDGLYTLTNLTGVWDAKHTVYTRIAGGQNKADSR